MFLPAKNLARMKHYRSHRNYTKKKLTTYPRTDARVLTTAMAKTIRGHIQGLCGYSPLSSICKHIADNGLDKTLPKTKYVNDAAVTDHYAIIPTGKI